MKDLKFEISFEEKKPKDGEPRKAYSEMWEDIEKIEGIERIEDFDFNSKRVTAFKSEETIKLLKIVKAFEGLSFVDWVKSAKKCEVR